MQSGGCKRERLVEPSLGRKALVFKVRREKLEPRILHRLAFGREGVAGQGLDFCPLDFWGAASAAVHSAFLSHILFHPALQFVLFCSTFRRTHRVLLFPLFNFPSSLPTFLHASFFANSPSPSTSTTEVTSNTSWINGLHYHLLPAFFLYSTCPLSLSFSLSHPLSLSFHPYRSTGKTYCICDGICMLSESGWEREANWKCTHQYNVFTATWLGKGSVLWSSFFLQNWNPCRSIIALLSPWRFKPEPGLSSGLICPSTHCPIFHPLGRQTI